MMGINIHFDWYMNKNGCSDACLKAGPNIMASDCPVFKAIY